MLEIAVSVKVADQRLVVLIYEYDYFTSRLEMSSLDYAFEATGHGLRYRSDSVLLLPFPEILIKRLVKQPLLLILLNVQVKTKHRIRFPIPIHRIDEESLEEFSLTFVEIFQSG